jgi:DNA helicase-2/ATP-dependent DNA helicase PcrA
VPSRFLDDIPAELTGEARRKTASRTTTWAPSPQPSRPVKSKFRAGQRVQHATFGEGLVIQSRVDGEDEVVTVHFEGVGLKRLMANMANLERLKS